MFTNTSSCGFNTSWYVSSKHFDMFSNTPLDFLICLDVFKFTDTCNKVISIKVVFPKAKTVNY